MTQSEDSFPTHSSEKSTSHVKGSNALPSDEKRILSGQSSGVSSTGRDYSRTHVLFSIPHNGQVAAGVLTSMRGASLKGIPYNFSSPIRSYHVYNFNRAWCDALNANPRPEFFVMHHADVMAEPGWMDKLVDLMDRHPNIDIISCNILIKDNSKEFSTAIYKGDEKSGEIIRMSVAELEALPPTFSLNDVQEKFPEKYKDGILCLNTGLWICKFRDAGRIDVDYPDGTSANIPWTENFCFKMIDAIVKSPDGKFHPHGMSEDWQASLDWHVMGVEYLATSEIMVHHFGGQGWSYGGRTNVE